MSKSPDGEYWDLDYRSQVRAGQKYDFAARMRANPSPPERLLWERRAAIRYQLARQVVVRGWIADFVCKSLRTIIEVDGQQHEDHWQADEHRDSVLAGYGYSTLRVSARTVLTRTSTAVEIVNYWLDEMSDLHRRSATWAVPSGREDEGRLYATRGLSWHWPENDVEDHPGDSCRLLGCYSTGASVG